MNEDQLVKMRLATAIFIFFFAVVAWYVLQRLVQITDVERDVRSKYAEILQNYSCQPIIHGLNAPQKGWCVVAGYYYPKCPAEFNGSIFNFTMVQ